jgi:hypothetical protein
MRNVFYLICGLAACALWGLAIQIAAPKIFPSLRGPDGAPRKFSFADLNPLRAIFDTEMKVVSTPSTPESLGFHGSAVTFKPIIRRPSRAQASNSTPASRMASRRA